MQNPKIKLKLICFASYKEQKVTVIEEGGGGGGEIVGRGGCVIPYYRKLTLREINANH